MTSNTKAILLLTAPLIAGRGTSTPDILKPGEYKRLARHLREIQRQPADLVSPNAEEILRACHTVIDENRLRRLLERGFLLGQAIERWRARAIWVVSRADAGYPRRLKSRLKEDAPAVLYGCGNVDLLERGGLAVEGSRHANEVLIDYTISIGRLAARAGRILISGGARGVDQAAMRGALEAGGRVCGVLADSLEKTVMDREYRNLLLNGQLVLISPYDPSAGFNVGNAMQRNKLIYALSDASLAVSSDFGKGGTWAGAVEQLDKLKFVPVYVRSTGESSAGLDALRKKGALAWPNPNDADSFNAIFNAAATMQTNLFSTTVLEEPTQAASESVAPMSEDKEPLQSKSTSAGELFETARALIQRLLKTPMKEAKVADELSISKAQARAWLQRLVDEGAIEKQKSPAGYVVKKKRLC
ncbi:MAG: DNA-processing protein DprA [Helicobacteraceae bacterium]|jgi:predicted Rossmann fold nucleotide-binding protein DprA/Smf involved in DNA uptake|nr:DNA-processing protein DprA [Helicobacteraceae bacterium]